MANDKTNPKLVGGLRALAGRPPRPPKTLSVVKYPATVRLIFNCELCDKAFPLEDKVGVRVVLDEEQARQLLANFSKDLEPRTIVCSCGHEAEYYPEDVGLFVLPEK